MERNFVGMIVRKNCTSLSQAMKDISFRAGRCMNYLVIEESILKNMGLPFEWPKRLAFESIVMKPLINSIQEA